MALIELNPNVGMFDRGVRLVSGICLMFVAAPGVDLLGESIFKYVIFLFGILNIATAFSGWCLVYHLVGISSHVTPEDSEK
ncbi:DUF2892 domain-containing protein [Loktanella salsilacus]|uniref:YgaP family membrane protein n=1 Tax=Loktanella salsilacus TaxID=195913 RepID=UPI0020B7CC3C|nr:DUF2892 domain-containing protein [Loktanella salsilacus]UTH48823.1 DUF2892 domain-containing protein [Loktanella salsilacus]